MKSKKTPFPFLPKDSVINYEEIQHKLNEIINAKESKYKDKLYYIYDKQSDRFIYIYDSNIFIINSKGVFEKYTRIELSETVKLAAVEYSCNFLLLLTKTNQVIIAELKNYLYEDYNNIFDKGNFLGGFFIKRKPDKDNKYCKLCMVNDKNFIISKIYTEKTEKGEIIFKRKRFFTSNEMKIRNYFYNSDFNVIIFKINKCDFILINLKSKYCYETIIPLDHINANNIMQMSTFLVRNIYHKLYFIHMSSKIIEFYGLKDLKNKKPPKVIQLEFGVYNQNIKLQFTNNLVFIYNDNNVYIYDIKLKTNNKILAMNYIRNKDYHIFYKNIKVCGDYLVIGRNVYKTIFNHEIYFNKNIKENEIDTFFITLRRDNTKHIIKKVLTDIFQNYEITKLYEYLSALIKNNARNERKINYNKKNAYQISFAGKNYFYLNSDEVFTIFSRKINGRDPIKIIQFMGVIYNLYQTNNIKVDNDIFISTLFYHLNQIKDFSFFDSVFKNGLIPLNHKLGLYLVDRATHPINEKKNEKTDKKNNNNDKDKIFNVGIENLMEKDEGINETVDELMDQEQYFECFDLISYYLCEKKFNKQGKFGYFKNFMSGGLTNFLRTDNIKDDENNNNIGEENMENNKD